MSAVTNNDYWQHIVRNPYGYTDEQVRDARNHLADAYESMRQQLAECQAREKVLRDGLVAIIDDAQDSVDKYHAAMKGYRQARHDRMDSDMQIARDALAMPSDSPALDAMLNQENRKGWERGLRDLNDAVKQAKREGFQAGYARGHNDTVEGCYNGSCECENECADDWMAEELK